MQWCEDDGEVKLWSPWTEEVGATAALLRSFADQSILGFNLAFDWFHICQMWTTLRLLPQNKLLADVIKDYVEAEPIARDGPCLKPVDAMDLMLFARRGPHQSLMARDDVRIRRVPIGLAQSLADELTKRVVLPNIFFAKKVDAATRWQVDVRDTAAEWADVVMRFAPTTKLKALAAHVLGSQVAMYEEVELDRKWLPVELGYAPFAKAIGKPGAWPDVIMRHVEHWGFDRRAREYARNDVIFTRQLWEAWGRPAPGDVDSELACLSGAARWRGYAIDAAAIAALAKEAAEAERCAPKAPNSVRKWLEDVLAPEERLVLQLDGKTTTKEAVLKEVMKLRHCVLCAKDEAHEACVLEEHPAAERAKLVQRARKGRLLKQMCDKLLRAGRFHAATNVIGTKSGRQSGGHVSEGKRAKKSPSLNPQGIQKNKRMRSCFAMAFAEEKLYGGDFDAFEVAIADGYYGDPQLHEDLTAPELDRVGKATGKRQKIHAVIGTVVFPHFSCKETKKCGRESCTDYWAIKESDGSSDDRYVKAKSALFALIYMGNAQTLARKLSIELPDAEAAFERVLHRYPVLAKKRADDAKALCAMQQVDGIGTEVTWTEPADCVESMLGFKRYFTLENKICQALFDLARAVPKSWHSLKVRVHRREREQTAAGAVQSALYGAAFQLQAANARAGGNHRIQSTGAGLTKILQERIWRLQPSGENPWVVRPLNIHDELQCPLAPKVKEAVSSVVTRFIEEHKKIVPLLAMQWKELRSWGAK